MYMYIRPKKKNCYVALSRPTVKSEKTGSGFFFFFFFLCQIWAKNLLKFVFNGLKKHLHDLYICVLTAFRPSFPHLETLKKILENSTLSRYVKKKKKSRPTDPIFKFWSGEGNITFFFFWPKAILGTTKFCWYFRYYMYVIFSSQNNTKLDWYCLATVNRRACAM